MGFKDQLFYRSIIPIDLTYQGSPVGQGEHWEVWSQSMIHDLGFEFCHYDTLNLPGASCCEAVNTPRFGSPWRVLRAWPWKVPWLSQKKKIKIKIP